MSKSKGNVVTPSDILEQHGSDAVRYWAASSRLGTDAAFDPQNPTQIKIGRRLAIKILNAAKFILGFDAPASSSDDDLVARVTEALDQSMLQNLAAVVDEATTALESYDHARALEVTETFFWTFCDDYLELVKERAYAIGGAGQESAVAALRLALSTLLRLFAPVVPFATEEAWSWFNDNSVHRSSWPATDELNAAESEDHSSVLPLASQALTGIRRAKTDAKASQKTQVDAATITAGPDELAALRRAEADLKAVGRIATLNFEAGEELAVTDITLAALTQTEETR
jgi:valyl-tRNA synthetase